MHRNRGFSQEMSVVQENDDPVHDSNSAFEAGVSVTCEYYHFKAFSTAELK